MLLGLSLAWLACARVLARYGAYWLPRDWAGRLTLHSFLSIVLVVSTALGVAASYKLLAAPRRALGLERHAAIGTGLLCAPITLVLSAYLGFKLALPTLIAEIQRGGQRAAQANTGEFGRALVESNAVVTLLWGIVLTPIAEELIFRGALWSAITNLTGGDDQRPPRLWQVLRRGGIATLLTAALFAWMHADQPGGAGIVRVVQAACLGLALGALRQHSGGIAAGIVLHATFNLITLSKVRRWLVDEGWPAPLPIPAVHWQIAAGCGVALALWWLHSMDRWRHAETEATIFVRKPRAMVFDLVVATDTIANVFKGHGPIPATVHAEIVSDGGMKLGAIRRITNSDGSVIDEQIVGFEPPELQAYRLTSGLEPPFSLLVSGACGRWQLDPVGDGTEINWRFGFDLRSAFLYPVARMLMRPFRIAMQRALERIRETCERDD
jgi:membrane protease YdiL (CAAX protease family)